MRFLRLARKRSKKPVAPAWSTWLSSNAARVDATGSILRTELLFSQNATSSPERLLEPLGDPLGSDPTQQWLDNFWVISTIYIYDQRERSAVGVVASSSRPCPYDPFHSTIVTFVTRTPCCTVSPPNRAVAVAVIAHFLQRRFSPLKTQEDYQPFLAPQSRSGDKLLTI